MKEHRTNTKVLLSKVKMEKVMDEDEIFFFFPKLTMCDGNRCGQEDTDRTQRDSTVGLPDDPTL